MSETPEREGITIPSFVRQARHDREQAQRRTREQNLALVALIEEHATDGTWAYTDIPAEGGEITLRAPDGKAWAISTDGTVAHA